MPANERYARQRLIPWWDQARLSRARVLVAGAGALGNEVLKNLALLGVGHLVVIDNDRIEPSNLSRAVLFTEADLGRPKVEAAAGALADLNPEVQVSFIDGDIFYDLGLGWLRHADLAIGCLDNLAARSQLGLGCALAGIPHLDGAMWSLGGEVRWFMAGDGPCFDCTLSADDRARAHQRHSCTGFRDLEGEAVEVAPTLATTAAVIGGLLAQEAAKFLCGQPVGGGQAIVYNGQALSMHRATLARDPDCLSSHTAYEAVRELPFRAAELTPLRLLAMAGEEMPGDVGGEASLELGRDFLVSLDCPRCGFSEGVESLLSRVSEGERICPRCGAVRDARVVRTLRAGESGAERCLAELGVPAAEVLAVRAGDQLRFYELSADVLF